MRSKFLFIFSFLLIAFFGQLYEETPLDVISDEDYQYEEQELLPENEESFEEEESSGTSGLPIFDNLSINESTNQTFPELMFNITKRKSPRELVFEHWQNLTTARRKLSPETAGRAINETLIREECVKINKTYVCKTILLPEKLASLNNTFCSYFGSTSYQNKCYSFISGLSSSIHISTLKECSISDIACRSSNLKLLLGFKKESFDELLVRYYLFLRAERLLKKLTFVDSPNPHTFLDTCAKETVALSLIELQEGLMSGKSLYELKNTFSSKLSLIECKKLPLYDYCTCRGIDNE